MLLTLAVAGCTSGPTENASGSDDAGAPQPLPSECLTPPTDATPDVMTLHRQVDDPMTVEIQFPDGTERGHAYDLEQWIDDEWLRTHVLFSNRGESRRSRTVALIPPPEDDISVNDFAVQGTDPDLVVLPDGLCFEFRICLEGPSGPKTCTHLE